MATIITDLKESFRRGNIYIQLIYINVGVFVLTTLTEVILQLFNRSLGGMFEWLELPASLSRFIVQPWSILTYVYACRSIAHPFQHALAVLVWRPVLKFLFCETPTGSIYLRRHLRWNSLHGCL